MSCSCSVWCGSPCCYLPEERESELFVQDIHVVYCDRCGMACRVADGANTDAKLLRASTVPHGHCLDCEVTAFLKVKSPMGQLIAEPSMLLWEPAQRQFGEVMRAGSADARPEDINWQRVVDNWDLPFVQATRRKRREV